MGKYLETIKVEGLIIKEEGYNKDNDAGVHSDLWNILMMYVYHLVLPNKVKRSLEGLNMLCLRWRKRKFIYSMFKWLEEKYGGFVRTQEGSTLVWGWNTGKRRESRRGRKVKPTKLEIDLIDLQHTLPRV